MPLGATAAMPRHGTTVGARAANAMRPASGATGCRCCRRTTAEASRHHARFAMAAAASDAVGARIFSAGVRLLPQTRDAGARFGYAYRLA